MLCHVFRLEPTYCFGQISTCKYMPHALTCNVNYTSKGENLLPCELVLLCL